MRNLREKIQELIEKGDLEGLLLRAGELHGHLCSYLAYGVRAGYIAMLELGVKNTGMEEVVSIVETNNCFSDGIQVVTGCSFGNNALIYKDLGKTAVTVARRDGTAVRIVLNPDYVETLREEYLEAYQLWDRIVVNRERVTQEKQERMMELFAEMAMQELKKPVDKVFRIQRLNIVVPDYAPIFSSVRCSMCGEGLMETKASVKNGKPACKMCADGEIYILDGRGISVTTTSASTP